jgi:hypothetical protein
VRKKSENLLSNLFSKKSTKQKGSRGNRSKRKRTSEGEKKNENESDKLEAIPWVIVFAPHLEVIQSSNE